MERGIARPRLSSARCTRREVANGRYFSGHRTSETLLPPPTPGKALLPPLAPGPGPGRRRGERGRVCRQTWDPPALEGLGDDGRRLVLGLAKGLAQLLHTVSVHDDGVPAGDREESEWRGARTHPPPPGAALTLLHSCRLGNTGEFRAPGRLSRLIGGPTLEFGSGGGLVVRELELRIRLCTDL